MKKNIIIYRGVVTLFVFTLPFLVHADSVNVRNTVKARATSGDNSARSGEIIEGRASVDIKVKTIVNGETLTDIEKHVESEDGEPINLEVDEVTTSDNARVNVRAKVGTQVENREVDRMQMIEARREAIKEEINERREARSTSRHSFIDFFARLRSHVSGLF